VNFSTRSNISTFFDPVDLVRWFDRVEGPVLAGKALENLRKYASVVNNAPLGSQVPVPEASSEFAGRQATLSGTDKRQLLDRIYMGMQATAEHGLQAMTKAGM
jgi:hypothetical protein